MDEMVKVSKHKRRLPSTIEQYYMTEACGIFAVVLAELLNKKIAVLGDEEGEKWSNKWSYAVVHAYVDYDGDNGVDIKGIRSVDKIKNDFLGVGSPIIESFSPTYFKKEFMGSSDKYPLYGASNEDINNAKQIILANPAKYGYTQ